MSISKHIKLSPNFFVFNIAILCLLLQSLKSRVAILNFCMWLLIAFELINIVLIVWQRIVSGNLRLIRHVKERCTQGDNIIADIMLENKKNIPFLNISVEDCLNGICEEKNSNSFIHYIAGKTTSKIKYNIKCKRRGKYILGPIKIKLIDMLGMISLSKEFPIYSTIYVYPQTFDIPRLPPLKKGNLPWFGLETRRASGDEDEFFGIREYREGDPIKKIHWYSTARKQKLIVKEFQKLSFYRASMLFTLNKEENLGKNEESVGEYIIKIASSVSKHLIENDVDLELMAHAQDFFHYSPNKGQQHLDKLMEFFASAKIESRIKIDSVIDEFYPYISSDSTIIIIATEKNLEKISNFLYSQRYNASIILIAILSFSFEYSTYLDKKNIRIKSSWHDILSATGIRTFFVSKKDNLTTMFSE